MESSLYCLNRIDSDPKLNLHQKEIAKKEFIKRSKEGEYLKKLAEDAINFARIEPNEP